MSNRLTYIIATFFLIFVFGVSISGIKNDSLTMDELPHLPAGYSYLTQKDMRLNPEHPPLIKDLAGIPLLFINGITFPSEISEWTEDVNGQWSFGNKFLFHSGNPTDKMIFWGRVPMILVLILLGFYIFKWTKEFFGNRAAIFALFLFSFSPTFLAHGRYITTDIGAAAGFLIATYYFIKSLEKPSKRNIILAGITFGLTQLAKFSTVMLVPLFLFLSLVWWLLKSQKWQEMVKTITLILIVGYLIVGIVYQYHVWNYPTERQVRDTEFLLSSQAGGPSSLQEACLSIKKIERCPSEITIWASDKPVLRAYTQYALGVLMVMQRAAGGHTTYFLGEVSASGWEIYFPLVYLIKETLTFHIFTALALIYAAILIEKPFWKRPFSRLKDWIKNHFAEFAMLCIIMAYWASSISSNLNIGVRHLLPTFAFVIILVSGYTIAWLKPPFLKVKYAIFFFLILWQAVSVISIYPHFLAYFNELVGGPDQGYIYVTNSNLDWGQNLKRLANWIDKQNKICALVETSEPCGIDKIYIDYFGGADVKYYLKEKYAPWWGTRNPEEMPLGSYLAVSASFLQGGRGEPAPGFDQSYGYYRWLYQYKPVAKIGYSIFIYKIE